MYQSLKGELRDIIEMCEPSLCPPSPIYPLGLSFYEVSLGKPLPVLQTGCAVHFLGHA